MAKRKKRKSSGKGGGAFGKAKARPRDEVIVPFPSFDRDGGSAGSRDPDDGFSPELMQQRMGEKEEFMAMVSREMAKQNFATPEEAQAYMIENFIGKPMEEMLAEHGRFDDSAEGRAMEILDEITPGSSPAKVRSTARRALKEDPDCVDAFMYLAQLQATLKKEIDFNRKAVAAGRRKFADLIETIDPQGVHGLWGHPEARSFLCAMQELAENLRLNGGYGAAIKTLEEVLSLNPNDNQGIRYELLVAYLGEDEWDRAQGILDRFADDSGCQFLYAKVFLELGRATADAPAEVEFSHVDGPFDGVPEESLVGARKALKRAIEMYPWSIGLLADMRMSMVKPLATYRLGSPAEALECARLSTSIWLGAPMSCMWLLAEARKMIGDKKSLAVLREFHDDFLDLCAAIEELPPLKELGLFEQTDGSSDEEELAQLMVTFSDSSEAVRDVLVDLGASIS
jgi:hypothetical protein